MLPKALQKRCAALDIDPETIEDVLAEPSSEGEGEVWIVKTNGDLPYATIGQDFTPHVSYQDALTHSVAVAMSVKVLVPFGKDGRVIKGFDTTTIPEDPTGLLLLLAPENIIRSVCERCNGKQSAKTCPQCHGTGYVESVPSLGDHTMVAPDSIAGFVEKRTRQRYLVVPASDPRIDQKPITTAAAPLKYAGRFGDMVIFRAPASFLAERSWKNTVHRTMMAALKNGEVKEGVRPVLLPDQVMVCRLVPSLGSSVGA